MCASHVLFLVCLVQLGLNRSAVTPLTAGKRQVLVVELWQGEERDCPHRCVQHWGPCEFKDGCGDGDGAGEIGDADALAAALAGTASAGHY